MKFLEKIKKIIEYIKNLEFQKKIILALIVVLVIANLVLGIILFTQKNVSVVKETSSVSNVKEPFLSLKLTSARGACSFSDLVCVAFLIKSSISSDWVNILLYLPFIAEFPTVGMCAFGFLLTFLGIILQGNSETIQWLMSKTNIYNRFILFNKRIVIVSFILSLYSYIIGYVDFQTLKDLLC